MFAEDPDLDRDEIVEALRRHWGIAAAHLTYEPVGFGSHHYAALDSEGSKWFLNLDDLHRKGWIADDPADNLVALERAFETARTLRDSGLSFVAAPVRDESGAVLLPVCEHYCLTVFEFIDAREGGFDDKLDTVQRRALLGALGALHGSTGVLDGTLRRDSLEIPHRSSLMRSLGDLGTTWTGGPFSEIARGLVARHLASLRARFARYDELAEAVRGTQSTWVVTHGEPHPGNLMWTDDSLVLIDWDTVAVGPPERDLWMVDVGDDLDAYTASGGAAEVRGEGIELYQLWWQLAEVAGYTETLRTAHRDDANTRASLAGLEEYLSAR